MKHTGKRIAALVLSVCLGAGAVIPALTGDARAADTVSTGVLITDEVIAEYKHGVFQAVTKNGKGQDLLAVPLYGEKMVIYNLDTWEVEDEVYTGVPNPRGTTVDSDGRVWVCGDAKTLFCYDPRSGQCFISKEADLGSGSFFAITAGDDGCLYFGTYSNGKVVSYDPDTNEFTDHGSPVAGASYVSAVVRRDGYIYAAAHGEDIHKVVKMKADGTEDTVVKDVADKMVGVRYMSGLNFIDGTDILVGYCSTDLIAFNASDMSEVTSIGGYTEGIKGSFTERYGDKVYFASYADLTAPDGKTYSDCLYCYDVATGEAAPMMSTNGEYAYGNILRCNNGAIIDGSDYLGIADPCVVTMQNQYVALYNLVTGKRLVYSGGSSPVTEEQGAGRSLRAMTNGPAGSKEIYFGAYDTNSVVSYNTDTGSLSTAITTAGSQTDAMYWYKGELYAGNYNVGSLTHIDPDTGMAKALFKLNDDAVFEQARIHTITAGDDKIFAGTTPDMYCFGGTIAWYDLTENKTYVAIGPESSDVYWAQTYDEKQYNADAEDPVSSCLVASPQWYSAETDEPVTLTRADFTGVIQRQTVNNLVYDEERDLLFGTTSIYGGTNTSKPTDLDAVLFVYDVAARQVIDQTDLTGQISGLTAPDFIAGLAMDPDYAENGRLWGVVSETLFSFTFDREKGFQVDVVKSFAKDTYWNGGSRQWFPRPILFDENYIYVAFDKTGGLCRFSRSETTQYEQLLPGSDNTDMLAFDYVLGEEGDLYYTNNSSGLYLLNLDPAATEKTAAAEVDALIDAIPSTVTAEDETAIQAAAAAYSALTLQEKALVSGYEDLQTAQIRLLVAQIGTIGTVTAEDQALVNKLCVAYGQVALKRRAEVTNYAVLAEAEEFFAEKVYGVAGGSAYKTLEQALDAAAGGTVLLLKDAQETEICLTDGVTLDLNGNTLTVDALNAYPDGICDGKVTDSSDGNNGLLVISRSGLVVREDNPELPLYDAEAGGYRFFDYHMQVHATGLAAGTGRQRFWFRLQLRTNSTDGVLDTDAYKLIAADGSNLEVGADWSWNDQVLQPVSFVQDGSSSIFSSGWATVATEKTWFYLTVSGFDRIAEAGTLAVMPCITANGVKAAIGNAAVYTKEYTGPAGSGGAEEIPDGLKPLIDN